MMIDISQLKALADLCVENTTLQKAIWITTESDFSHKLKTLHANSFPLLAFITPSYDPEGDNTDNLKYVGTYMFFILDKPKFQTQKESTLSVSMNETLAIANEIISFLLNGFPGSPYCTLINGIIPSSFHVDPEFNFLGCNGWSLAFDLKS